MKERITSGKSGRELQGFVALIITTLMYGFWGVLVRTVSASESPIFVQSVLRSVAISIILALIALISRGRIQWPSKQGLLLYGARSLMGMTSFIFGYYGFLYLPIATVYIYFYTGFVIGGFLMGKAIYKENMTGVKYLSLVFALLGVGLNYFFEANISLSVNIYTIMVLFAGILSAFWSSFSNLLPKKMTDIESGLFDSMFAIIIALALSAIVSEPVIFPSGTEWFYQGLFIFVAIVAGQLTIFGFKRIEAQVGSIIMLLEIVFATVIGMMMYSEIPSWYTILGGILIIVGSTLPIIYGRMHLKQSS